MQHADQRDFEVSVEPVVDETVEGIIDWRLAAKLYVMLLVISPLMCAVVKWLATGKWPVWVEILRSRASF